jgi:phage-related protein (TIGR01555 family)
MTFNPAKWIRDWRNERELEHRRERDRHELAETQEEYAKKLLNIDDGALAMAMIQRGQNAFLELPKPKFSLHPYTPPFKNVAPADHILAMDESYNSMIGPRPHSRTGMFAGTGGFPGFPYLTELLQINEYRDITDCTVDEMTRKWIEHKSSANKDRTDVIKQLDTWYKDKHVKEWFNWAGKFEGYMGRSQLFTDFGDEDEELVTPLALDPSKIRKGSFKRFKGIEPITTYPAEYNASDPLDPCYYVIESWFVYSKKVHSSRLLEFNSRPLPDLLKPVFNFSGMSLSQLAQPYIDYWLSSRDSAGRLLRNFSTATLKTNMNGILQGQNYESFKKRLMFFTAMQQNNGVFMLDKLEEFGKENTPLSGVKDLVSQAQEHMATVAKVPLSVMFGLSPSGLTTTAESDITIYNNRVNARQEAMFRQPLEAVDKIAMLDLFGEIYDDITFDFVDLVSMNGKEQALIRKSDGETDAAYITAGVVEPEEVRAKIAADPDSGYNNLDPNKKITPPAQQEPPKGGSASSKMGSKPGQSGAPDPDMQQAENSNDSVNPLLQDAARMTMDEATRLAGDTALWPGNQHTGTLNDGDPSVNAMKHTAVAQKATNVANTVGTKASHEKAFKAHDRACKAHQLALATADKTNKRVHKAYIDAHETAMGLHQMESAPQPEEVED